MTISSNRILELGQSITPFKAYLACVLLIPTTAFVSVVFRGASLWLLNIFSFVGGVTAFIVIPWGTLALYSHWYERINSASQSGSGVWVVLLYPLNALAVAALCFAGSALAINFRSVRLVLGSLSSAGLTIFGWLFLMQI